MKQLTSRSIAFSEILLTYAYRKFFVYILPESLEPDGLLQLLSTDYKFAVTSYIVVMHDSHV